MADYVLSEQLKQQIEEVIRWRRQQAGRPPRQFQQPQLLGGTDFRYFELKDNLTPGETKTAYLQEWNGSIWETTTDADKEFEVIDDLSIYRGRGKDKIGSLHGSYGKAQFNSDSDKWEIIELQPHALMITGAAYTAFSGTGTFAISSVTIMQPTGSIRVDVAPTVNTTVYNPGGLSGSVDTVIVAEWNETTGYWVATGIVTGSSTRHFELKDDLSPGTTVTAYLREWSGSAWVTSTDAGDEFEVTDAFSQYRGRKKDKFSSPHNVGSIGKARLNSESSQWEIVEITPHALWITGDVYAAFTTTDATFEVDGVKVMLPTGSIIVNTDPAANITVNNDHDWDGTANDLAEIRWNEVDADWDCVELDC